MKTVALGDLVDFYSGGTPSKANAAFWQGDVPWFSAKDMKKARLTNSADHIADVALSSTSLRKLPAGTIAMVVRGMILAHTIPISVLDVDAAINQDLKALLPKRPVDTSFLAAMLRAQQATILSQVSTAAHGTKKLESRVLEELRIPFPPLAEQCRIAAVLDQADALRTKRGHVLAHLDSLTQAIFHDMFGDYRADAALGAVSEIQGGLQVSFRRCTLPVEVPYLRVANVQRSRLDLSELKTLRATNSEIRRTRLLGGDLLFVEGHANPMEVGRAAMWDNQVNEVVHQNHLIRSRLDARSVLPAFAVTWFNSEAGASHFRQAGKTTSGLNTISSSTVRSAPIPLPSLSLQSEFERVMKRLGTLREVLYRAQIADGELFTSLQSRAFRGEL